MRYQFLWFVVCTLVLGLAQAFLLESSSPIVYFVFVTLSLQTFIWLSVSPKQSFFLGIIFGISFFTYASRWIFEAAQHFGVSDVTAVFFVFMIICVLAFTTGLSALVITFVGSCRNRKALFVLGIASAWFLGEWLRTWIFTGLPLFQLGYGFVDTPLSGFMTVAGTISIGFIIAALCATFILSWYEKRFLITSILICCFVFITGKALQSVDFTSYQESIDVRVISGEVSKKAKQNSFAIKESIDKYLELTKQSPQVDLVVWPESSIPESFMHVYKKQLKKELLSLSNAGTEVILGTYLKELRDGIKNYNVLLVGGDVNKRYYKRHRVPFGEYMPSAFQYFFPSGFLEDLDPVDFDQANIQVKHMLISPTICFELLFPDLVHAKNTNLLINTSDLSWFENKLLAKKVSNVAKARAIEAGKYLVKSDNYGESAIVNHKGELIAVASSDQGYVDANIQLREGSTIYVTVKNYPLLGCVFTILLLLLWAYKVDNKI